MGTPTQADAVIRKALDKASEGEWWRLVAHQWDRGCWYVPSATVPGSYYAVRVRPGSSPRAPWWDRLACDCPNEQIGRRVCWHKAAVKLHWQHISSVRRIFRGADSAGYNQVGEYRGNVPERGEWPDAVGKHPTEPDRSAGVRVPGVLDAPVVHHQAVGGGDADVPGVPG